MKTCPRCNINILKEPIHKNALSRKDNETYICDSCGMAEAIEEFIKHSGK